VEITSPSITRYDFGTTESINTRLQDELLLISGNPRPTRRATLLTRGDPKQIMGSQQIQSLLRPGFL